MAEIVGNTGVPVDKANLISSGVSAGSGIIGSIINNVYNRKRQREAMAWSEKMQDKINQYNLPINQMKRLKEAGINPNLAFGSAASAMGSPVGSVPHYSESADFGAPIRQGINDYFSRRFEKAQAINAIREQNADIDKKETENETMHLLLDDYRGMKRSEYALGRFQNEVDRQLYGRKAGLEVDYLSAKWLNELDRYFAHIPQALAKHYQAQDELLRTKNMSEYQDFLTKRSRGRYERFFYDRNLNPYETSTIAGALRTIFGVGETIDSTGGSPVFGLKPGYFDPKPTSWFDWKAAGKRRKIFENVFIPYTIMRYYHR